MTQINTEKVVAYGVEIPTPAVQTEKAVVYGVEVVIPAISTEKVVAYATEANDNSGAARQFTSANRPLYKSGPLPYISFATAGTSLVSDMLVNETKFIVRLAPDGTTYNTSTSASATSVTTNQDFNQLAIIPTRFVQTRTLDLVKVNMRLKAFPSS